MARSLEVSGEATALAAPLFSTWTDGDSGRPHGFPAAPPLPLDWTPGMVLELRGPLGRGFRLPAAARRIALVAWGSSPARLLPLVAPALAQGADLALFCRPPLPRLPAALEAQPLNALPEALNWADFMALDASLEELSETFRAVQRAQAFAVLPCPGQVLVDTVMPCAGLAECGACALPTRRGWKLACQDGPVFDWQEILGTRIAMSKYDLPLRAPLMNAAGTLGFAPDLRGVTDIDSLGAFVTNPVSLGARTLAHNRCVQSFPGGFLLHTGYPNPGLKAVLRRYAGVWGRAPLPVVMHLLPQTISEVSAMLRLLDGVDGIAGLELGLPPELDAATAVAFTQAAVGELPLIVRLPFEGAAGIAKAVQAAGAAAVSLGAPRVQCPCEATWYAGRLYGPAVLPHALALVGDLARQGVRVIACGGIYTPADMQAMLSAGALAVQLDAVLWRGGWGVSAPTRWSPAHRWRSPPACERQIRRSGWARLRSRSRSAKRSTRRAGYLWQGGVGERWAAAFAGVGVQGELRDHDRLPADFQQRAVHLSLLRLQKCAGWRSSPPGNCACSSPSCGPRPAR